MPLKLADPAGRGAGGAQGACGRVRRHRFRVTGFWERHRRTRRLHFLWLALLALPMHPSRYGSGLEGCVDVIRVRKLGHREPRLAKAALHASDSWSGL